MAWAIREAGISISDFANNVKVTPDVVDAWIAETIQPSKAEFAKLVGVLSRPSAIFFMPNPPVQENLPAAFRRAPGADNYETGIVARRELRKARRIQKVVSWLLEGESDHAGLPKFDYRKFSAATAGRIFRAQTGIPLEAQADWKDKSTAAKLAF